MKSLNRHTHSNLSPAQAKARVLQSLLHGVEQQKRGAAKHSLGHQRTHSLNRVASEEWIPSRYRFFLHH